MCDPVEGLFHPQSDCSTQAENYSLRTSFSWFFGLHVRLKGRVRFPPSLSRADLPNLRQGQEGGEKHAHRCVRKAGSECISAEHCTLWGHTRGPQAVLLESKAPLDGHSPPQAEKGVLTHQLPGAKSPTVNPLLLSLVSTPQSPTASLAPGQTDAPWALAG